MDNIKKLKYWISVNAETLKLQVERMRWVDDWFPGYFDFAVSAQVDGQIFTGRGIAGDEDTAFLKALSEMVERVYCFYHKIGSNGVAAHPDRDQAILNAKKELIERDAVLCHTLTNTPFFHFLAHDLKEYHFIMDHLSTKGVSLKLAQAHSSVPDLSVVICTTSGEGIPGQLFGFGCDHDLQRASLKAIFECMLNSVAILEGHDKLPPLRMTEFLEMKVHGPDEHKRVHFTEKLFCFNTGSTCLLPRPGLTIDDISTHELLSPMTLFDSIPLTVMKAQSGALQKMFYGPPKIENVNINRLTNFAGRTLTISDLVSITHPIG
ncbi:MAG: YcaO-like family protein [Bdellovibrio sp.]|nr:YcaO-like family protein [Bdellovibrio sp.]